MRFIFYKCFIFIFSLGAIAASVLVVSDDALSNFSSIIITPPKDTSESVDHSILRLPQPIRKYGKEGEREPFGYGHLFTYNTKEDFGDVAVPFTHRNILQRLKAYKDVEHPGGKYADSNLLFVRLRFKLLTESSNHSFECFFGLFSSGVTKKSDTKTISQYYSLGFRNEHPLKREAVSRLLREEKLLHHYCLLDVTKDLPEVGYDADVYDYRLFRLDGHNAKRVIFSNVDYVKVKSGESFNKNLRTKVESRLNFINAEEVKKYFGCSDKVLFDESKTGIYFNQSEQAFFNSLEAEEIEAFFGSTAPVIATSAAVAATDFYDARMDIYSYRDICVVCRGNIARLLHNGWLTKNVTDTIRRKSGSGNFCIRQIESVYAHSILGTDVCIAATE